METITIYPIEQDVIDNLHFGSLQTYLDTNRSDADLRTLVQYIIEHLSEVDSGIAALESSSKPK